MSNSILIRVDVTQTIGAGHFIRQLALALHLKIAGYTVYVLSSIDNKAYVELLKKNNITLIPISNSIILYSKQDYTLTINTYAKIQAHWLILDGYSFNSHYQKALKRFFINILSVDDFSDYTFYSDIILNPNTLDTSFYNAQAYTRLFLGPEYLLLRPSFLKNKPNIKHNVTKQKLTILISFGASDNENITEQVIMILNKIDIEIDCHILIGNMNKNVENIKISCKKNRINPIIHPHLNEQALVNLIKKADLAITACSTILWECLILNVPVIGIKTVDNQALLLKMLQEKKWASVYTKKQLSTIEKAILTFIKTKKTSKDICVFSYKNKLSNLTNTLKKSPIVTLTEAKKEDCDTLFKWANDPLVRKNSLQSDTINYNDHVKWFNSRLNSPNETKILIAYINHNPIGQIRFDKKDNHARISFLISPLFRGKGLGKILIKRGILVIGYIWKELQGFYAEVKENNISSNKIFKDLNFTISKNNIFYYEYTLSNKD